MEADSALALSGRPECVQFLVRPVGLNITRRHYGYQNGDATEFFDKRFGEVIVAFELGIAPDLRLLAQKLADTHFERSMKIGDPTLLTLDQLDIIQMRVADKCVALEVHSFLSPSPEPRPALQLRRSERSSHF